MVPLTCLTRHYLCTQWVLPITDVPGTGFWNGPSSLKQYFVLSKNGAKYYLKYTFLAFPVLGILGLGTPLLPITGQHSIVAKEVLQTLGAAPIAPKHTTMNSRDD